MPYYPAGYAGFVPSSQQLPVNADLSCSRKKTLSERVERPNTSGVSSTEMRKLGQQNKLKTVKMSNSQPKRFLGQTTHSLDFQHVTATRDAEVHSSAAPSSTEEVTPRTVREKELLRKKRPDQFEVRWASKGEKTCHMELGSTLRSAVQTQATTYRDMPSSNLDLQGGTTKLACTQGWAIPGYTGHVQRAQTAPANATRQRNLDSKLDHHALSFRRSMVGYSGHCPTTFLQPAIGEGKPTPELTTSGSAFVQHDLQRSRAIQNVTFSGKAAGGKPHTMMQDFFSGAVNGETIASAERYFAEHRPLEGLPRLGKYEE